MLGILCMALKPDWLSNSLQTHMIKTMKKCPKPTKCSLFSTLRGPLVNRKDLQALTLVEPKRNNQVLEP